MQANTLLEQFLELSETLTGLKKRKYEQMRGYYKRNFGKDTFRPNYYDEMKFEFERLERLDEFFNLLNEDSQVLFAIADSLRTMKRKRQQSGLSIEYVQIWIPLVQKVENLGNCYLINLLNTGGLGDSLTKI